jgi:dipeptidyl aminopeptidase/acylaminoacyl peptidase
LMAAFRKHGVTHEWLSKRNEGHGFVNEENRIEYYKKIDDFIRPFRS